MFDVANLKPNQLVVIAVDPNTGILLDQATLEYSSWGNNNQRVVENLYEAELVALELLHRGKYILVLVYDKDGNRQMKFPDINSD